MCFVAPAPANNLCCRSTCRRRSHGAYRQPAVLALIAERRFVQDFLERQVVGVLPGRHDGHRHLHLPCSVSVQMARARQAGSRAPRNRYMYCNVNATRTGQVMPGEARAWTRTWAGAKRSELGRESDGKIKIRKKAWEKSGLFGSAGHPAPRSFYVSSFLFLRFSAALL